MIRPLTIATVLLACGSGLYLYQSKHEVQLLDRTIERNVHDTATLREQSRLLAAEWTMLNDPERLRQFSDTYLKLKTITPSQFTSLADLNVRLPAPLPEVPAHSDEPEPVPVALENGSSNIDTAPATVVDENLPIPPMPVMRPPPVAVSLARPPEPRAPEIRAPEIRTPDRPSASRTAALAEARQSDQRPTEQRPADQHPPDQRMARATDARTEVRTPAVPPPRPVALAGPRPSQAAPPPAPLPMPVFAAAPPPAAQAAPSAPFTGSLLGMARGSMPQSPRPTPVNASYNAN